MKPTNDFWGLTFSGFVRNPRDGHSCCGDGITKKYRNGLKDRQALVMPTARKNHANFPPEATDFYENYCMVPYCIETYVQIHHTNYVPRSTVPRLKTLLILSCSKTRKCLDSTQICYV